MGRRVNSSLFGPSKESPARAGRAPLWIALLLATGVLAVHGRSVGFEFINFDDNVYVTENPTVLAGLTPGGISWAFTTFHASNWHPLTWLSLMLDAEIGGVNPAVYHASNLLLHLAATLVLFVALRRMTGRDWPSGFVAALFALHPLHVESVVWIAERKDVLSAVFWFLTMGAYARYAERPGRGRMLLVTLALGMGLLAKPMLVSLPIVLLLLDHWPLQRSTGSHGIAPHRGSASWSEGMGERTSFARAWRPLVLEKLPLFALAAASCAITLVAQSRSGAVKPLVSYPVGDRIANAAVSAASYLLATVWPANLAVFYPHPRGVPTWQAAGCGLLLAGITALVLALRRKRPWLVTGWFWYLVTLAPVIGLVQVGDQARADRYTYVPLVGVFLAIVWEVRALSGRAMGESSGSSPGGAVREARTSPIGTWLRAAALPAILALSTVSYVQTGYWRDGVSLFERAVASTTSNRIAENNLGSALFRKGRVEEAIEHYTRAIEIDPGYADAHANLAGASLHLGRIEEAIAQAREALRLRPDAASAHANLALALMRMGNHAEAAEHLAEDLRLRPESARAHLNLGVALMLQGRREDAITRFEEALRRDPASVEIRLNLGAALVDTGRVDEGLARIEDVLRDRPDDARALGYLEIAKERERAAEASAPGPASSSP